MKRAKRNTRSRHRIITVNEYDLKAERRERRKKNRRFPMHGRASIQDIMQAIYKRGKMSQTNHTFTNCWCGHEKGHRWNGSVLKCDPCIKTKGRVNSA